MNYWRTNLVFGLIAGFLMGMAWGLHADSFSVTTKTTQSISKFLRFNGVAGDKFDLILKKNDADVINKTVTVPVGKKFSGRLDVQGSIEEDE